MPEVAATTDQIASAVESIALQRPAYRPLLEYYRKVFAAQITASQGIHMDAPTIDAREAAVRRENGFGMLSLSEFPVEAVVSARLLRELCAILSESRPECAAAAIGFATAIENGERNVEPLFRAVLEESDAIVASAGEETGLAAEVLAALLYQSLAPSLRHISTQIAALLPPEASYEGGHCPVCGSEPAISVIDETGKRALFCSFCWHQWPVRRVACPHCGNAEDGKREYFYDSAEKEYRVDVCNKCRRYMKTIDLRQLNRPLYPPLEQVATMHLDMLAQEKGFTKAL